MPQYVNIARHGMLSLHGGWVIIDESVTDPAHREYMNVTFTIDQPNASPSSVMQVYVPQQPGFLELSDEGVSNVPVTRGSAIARMILNAIEIGVYLNRSGQRYAQTDLQLIGLGAWIYPYATDEFGPLGYLAGGWATTPGRDRLAQRRYASWDHDRRVQAFLLDRDYFSDYGDEGAAWWTVGAYMVYTRGGWVYGTVKHNLDNDQLEMYLLPVGETERRGPFRLRRR